MKTRSQLTIFALFTASRTLTEIFATLFSSTVCLVSFFPNQANNRDLLNNVHESALKSNLTGQTKFIKHNNWSEKVAKSTDNTVN